MRNYSASSQNKVSKLLLVTVSFMALGTVLELYLLGHYEGGLQLIPTIVIALAVLLLIGTHLSANRLFSIAFRISLLLSALSGIVGVYLHLKANFEFEQELNAKADFAELTLESISGALPVLAPGSMILLALIGYSYLKTIKLENENPN